MLLVKIIEAVLKAFNYWISNVVYLLGPYVTHRANYGLNNILSMVDRYTGRLVC